MTAPAGVRLGTVEGALEALRAGRPVLVADSPDRENEADVILAAQSAGFILGGVVTLRYRPDRILLVATLAIFPMAVPILLLAAPAPVVVIALASSRT